MFLPSNWSVTDTAFGARRWKEMRPSAFTSGGTGGKKNTGLAVLLFWAIPGCPTAMKKRKERIIFNMIRLDYNVKPSFIVPMALHYTMYADSIFWPNSFKVAD